MWAHDDIIGRRNGEADRPPGLFPARRGLWEETASKPRLVRMKRMILLSLVLLALVAALAQLAHGRRPLLLSPAV